MTAFLSPACGSPPAAQQAPREPTTETAATSAPGDAGPVTVANQAIAPDAGPPGPAPALEGKPVWARHGDGWRYGDPALLPLTAFDCVTHRYISWDGSACSFHEKTICPAYGNPPEPFEMAVQCPAGLPAAKAR